MCSTLVAPEIKSDRLTLRRPFRGDAARVAKHCSDFAIPSMSTRMPWPYGMEDAEIFIDGVLQQDRVVENTFMIDDEQDDVVGCVGLFTTGRTLEIGYWIGRPYWGRGYATEATRAALNWAKESWGKKVVMAGHFADNAASGQVLIKCGFLYTGEVKRMHSLARGQETPTRMMVWIA